MNNEELKLKIAELIPSAVFEEGGEWVTVFVDAKNWKDLAQALRSGEGLSFDYLFHNGVSSYVNHLPAFAGDKIKTR